MSSGGKVKAKSHIDLIIRNSKIVIDRKTIQNNGELRIENREILQVGGDKR